MKKKLRILISICFALITTFAFSCISQAAKVDDTIYLYTFTKGPKDSSMYGYDNDTYADIKCKIVSNSNPSVVSAKVVKVSDHNQLLSVVPKKNGSTIIKLSQTLDGKKYSWNLKVVVKKYECPFKKITVGKTDITKYFKYNTHYDLKKSSLSGVLKFTLKPGWKLNYADYSKTASSKSVDVKSGKKISLKKKGSLFISLRYKNTYEYMLTSLTLK